MNAAKVVPSEMQTIRSPQILPLLTEGISQPSEAADGHTDGEILTLNMRSANPASIGVAHDWDHLHSNHFGGSVAPLFLQRGSVALDLHRVIAAVTQRGGDCRNVGLEPIGGDLEALTRRGRVAQAFDENVCGGLIATAQSIQVIRSVDRMEFPSTSIRGARMAMSWL